jgi:hypothetical protein
MKLFYIDTFPEKNGEHLVHHSECKELPNFINRKFLGYYEHCNRAIIEAKKEFNHVNGCVLCSITCHKNTIEAKK